MRAAILVLVLWMSGPVNAAATLLGFDDLQGWAADDHAAALVAFQRSCGDLKDDPWPALCDVSQHVNDAKSFFEAFFLPVEISREPGLFTGYFEPEIAASRVKTATYTVPIYGVPGNLPKNGPWLTRAQIETGNDLAGQEIAWARDPVDVFFMQVQGSGRLVMEDGSQLRLGFGAKNGHEYRSIGQELIRRGIYTPHQVSMDVIRNWVSRNPEDGRELLHHNDSYVFFRVLTHLDPTDGPLGAMNRPLTPGRSLAVDPAFVRLGVPVWVEKNGTDPWRRLMVAQDTGSAIKGVQRADLFIGTGTDAGRTAGKIKDPGRFVPLLPIELALSLTGES